MQEERRARSVLILAQTNAASAARSHPSASESACIRGGLGTAAAVAAVFQCPPTPPHLPPPPPSSWLLASALLSFAERRQQATTPLVSVASPGMRPEHWQPSAAPRWIFTGRRGR